MFISQSLHHKKVVFVKARVYEAIVHSFVANLFLSLLLKIFIKNQLLRANIASIPGSLDEIDHVRKNIICLGASILPEDISYIPELMFLQLRNNRSELFDHKLQLEAIFIIRSLFFGRRFFNFSV